MGIKPFTVTDWVARIAGAIGIGVSQLNNILDKAVQQFPDADQRAQYIREQIRAAVPDASGIENAIDGLIQDVILRSATIDTDATGGAV